MVSKKVSPNTIVAVILAGGRGSRMNSSFPKVLLPVGGEPIIFRSIGKLARIIQIENIVVVVGYKHKTLKKEISKKYNVGFAKQQKPLGTADALKTALEKVIQKYDHILVINGDDPAFYTLRTLNLFINSHLKTNAAASMLTLEVEEENNLGRIFRDSKDEFVQILEVFEYKESKIISNEINCGLYIFNKHWAKEAIKKVVKNKKGEYPITDLFNLAKQMSEKINLYKLQNKFEWAGINTPEELEYAQMIFGGGRHGKK